MQSKNRFFDDAAKLAGGALGTLDGIRREIESVVRQQVERFLSRMDLVTRDEFDAVKAMAAKAREEQDDMAARIARLEAAAGAAGAKKPSARKPSARKPSSKKPPSEGGSGAKS